MTLVRDRRHLLESFATSAEYLQDATSGDETPNFWDYGIELTRPARAMKLWFTLQAMGERALGEAIDHGFNVLGVIVEVQLSRDENKRYTWPAYMANLRDRYRCPVCLLVITTDDSVARWAGRSIVLGPGTRCTPWVIGPSNAPVVTESHYAKENVELAVLSAVEHLRNPDVELVERILEAAVGASAKLDSDRCQLYFDLISLSLPADAPKELKDLMNSLGFEYQSDYARRYAARGRAEGMAEGRMEGRIQGLTEGRMEGRMELILALLTKRLGPLSDSIQTRIRRAHDARPDETADLLLTAQTIEQALGSLP